MRRNLLAGIVAGAMVVGAIGPQARAYIEKPFSLGEIEQECTHVVLVRVQSVDRQNNVITYRKVEDIKGVHPTEEIHQNIAHAGFNPREWQNVMAWAAEGKLAVICYNDSGSETCIDRYWFQCYARRGNGAKPGEWWDMYHGEPFLLRSYAGKPEKMAEAMRAMLKGEQVTVPCMVDGDKNSLAIRTARIQQMRASLKLLDYNAARDFAGWGGGQIQPVRDMAGFEQISRLPVMGGGSGWGVVSGHLEGADKTDLVLFSEDRVAILVNAGEGSFDEVELPGEKGEKGMFGGARAAAVAVYNGTGLGSVLLATPSGPRLLTGMGGEKVRDDSAALPKRAYWGLKGAAWVEMGDKDRPAILLADEFGGLRVLRNKTAAAVMPQAAPVAPGADRIISEMAAAAIVPGTAEFEDISDAAGLGEHGLGSGMTVMELVVADLNGGGSQQVIVNGADGKGVVLGVKDGKFFQVKAGLNWEPGSRIAVGDLDGDGKTDVVAIGGGGMRVWRNVGGAKFVDATGGSGLAAVGGTSAVMVPRFEAGKTIMDLFVGSVGGCNRFFENNGKGNFTEKTEAVGLNRRIFNSRAVGVLPAAKGREASADLVMVNEGQVSAVLLWKK